MKILKPWTKFGKFHLKTIPKKKELFKINEQFNNVIFQLEIHTSKLVEYRVLP